MEKFIGIVLTIVLVFWILKIIGRLLLRMMLLRAQRTMESAMNSSSGFNNAGQQANNRKKEGELTIENIEPTQHVVNPKIGEYVDFEEIPRTTRED